MLRLGSTWFNRIKCDVAAVHFAFSGQREGKTQSPETPLPARPPDHQGRCIWDASGMTPAYRHGRRAGGCAGHAPVWYVCVSATSLCPAPAFASPVLWQCPRRTFSVFLLVMAWASCMVVEKSSCFKGARCPVSIQTFQPCSWLPFPAPAFSAAFSSLWLARM